MTTGDLRDRSFFITGASSGIGRAMADALAARGGRVILASRSEASTRAALDAIRAANPAVDAELVTVDLADLASVRRAADAYLATGRPIDVLVNNAGVAGTRTLSADGFDLTFAVNHIGPFLLTNLLLPRVRESPEGRIVNVSSEAHFRPKEIDWAGLERRATARRGGFEAYANTKLMNVLHAKELARRLAGTRITTSSLHPGAVASNIWRSVFQPLRWIMMRFMLSNEEGAKTPVYCATAAEVPRANGGYFHRCREVPGNPVANDVVLAGELWERTEKAIADAEGRRRS